MSPGALSALACAEYAQSPNHIPARIYVKNLKVPDPGQFEPISKIAPPPLALAVDADSAKLFAEGAPTNAFSGVVDAQTGAIYLYPLKESDADDDGYGNTPWVGTGTFAGSAVEPIDHFEDRRAVGGGWVSHEILSLLVEEAKAGKSLDIKSKADDLTPLIEEKYIGFTLWKNRPNDVGGRPWFVWSSRGCNKNKFYSNSFTRTGGGHPTKEWAEAIAAAAARDLKIYPYS